MAFENVGDGFIAETIAEFEQFPFDLAIAPIIFLSELHDQTFQVNIRSWSSAAHLTLICPLPAHQLTMPFEHSFRLEDANDIVQLFNGLPRYDFQFKCQYSECQFLCS